MGSIAEFTRMVKKFARNLGVSLVGVASVDRFEGAPQGHGPNDFVPDAQSVISIGVRIPEPIVEYDKYHLRFQGYPTWASSTVSRFNWMIAARNSIYMQMGHWNLDFLLDQASIRLALMLEDMGYRSMPTPTISGSQFGSTSSPLTQNFAVFSQRHAAVRAGLGEFGLCNIVVTPEFGLRVRFGSIITEAKLLPDPLLTDKVCLREKCHKEGPRCLRACPSGAMQPLKDIDHGAVFIDTPSMTDPQLCSQLPGVKFEHGRWYACVQYGACVRACPIKINLKKRRQGQQNAE